jgi:hypothetical protein
MLTSQTSPLAFLTMDTATFKQHILTLTPVEIWIAHHNDPEFAESCRLLIRDNNAYDAINHIVSALWFKNDSSF